MYSVESHLGLQRNPPSTRPISSSSNLGKPGNSSERLVDPYESSLDNVDWFVKAGTAAMKQTSSECWTTEEAFPLLMTTLLSSHVAETNEECNRKYGRHHEKDEKGQDLADMEEGEQISLDKEEEEGCDAGDGRRRGEEDKLSKEHRLKLLLDNVAPFYLLQEGWDKVSGGRIFSNPLSEAKAGEGFSRDLWRYVTSNMEPEYRLPTLILKKHEYIKREEPRNLGPGSYNPNYYEEIQKAKKMFGTRGRMSSCAARFPRSKIKSECPNPGAYGNPYEKLSAYYENCKHSGKVTLLESGPCDIRKGLFGNNGSALGPGDYETKSCEDTCKKSRRSSECSLLRPKDRFAMVHGYHKTNELNLEPGMYNVTNNVKDVLFNTCNVTKGKFGKLNRDQRLTGERITVTNPMWPTIATEGLPGPGQYTPQQPKNRQVCWGNENYWGFNSSILEVRPREVSDYDRAPNCYRPELAHANNCYIPGGGHVSQFKSVIGRLDPVSAKSLSSRLRPKDIPPHEYRQKHSICAD